PGRCTSPCPPHRYLRRCRGRTAPCIRRWADGSRCSHSCRAIARKYFPGNARPASAPAGYRSCHEWLAGTCSIRFLKSATQDRKGIGLDLLGRLATNQLLQLVDESFVVQLLRRFAVD